jgi:hypothetical protein
MLLVLGVAAAQHTHTSLASTTFVPADFCRLLPSPFRAAGGGGGGGDYRCSADSEGLREGQRTNYWPTNDDRPGHFFSRAKGHPRK